MKRVHDSLVQVFQKHRLVFWYDPKGEWTKTNEAFLHEGVTKLTVSKNEFGTKVRILSDPNPRARFLVYVPAARPPDGDNWLLDLLLQGHEFKADGISLAMQEAGLPYEFRPLAEQHAEFFKNPKRVQALRELFAKDDGPAELRLKMMSVLTGTAVEFDAVLLEFLKQGVSGGIFDPVEDLLLPHALLDAFWREVKRLFDYTSPAPSLRDFTVTLFRAANPLDSHAPLTAHARVFLQRWKDSQTHNVTFRSWSHNLERDFHLATKLDALTERTSVGDSDTFEIFEKFTLHQLCKSFDAGAAADEIRKCIQSRRSSFWYPQHQDGYLAVFFAVELRELSAAAELSMDSIDAGLQRYRASWWRVDRAYRRCCYHLRRYGQVNLMEHITAWVEKTYVNNFLLPLADRWSDHVSSLAKWECKALVPQGDFFERHVQPYLKKNQKVFIIVSDALRYEAAADFAERLNSENRFTAEMDAAFGVLPSYTQLGMASLLPGRQWVVDPDDGTVTVDGRNATGTENRKEILQRAVDGKGTAIQAEHFLDLNTKTEGRALMRDHEVIYIFQNVIDKVGDSLATEAKTVEAVEQAFDELMQIVKKVANINGNNMILTADHGFLFQQDDLHEDDATPLPGGAQWTNRNRRFALGRQIHGSEGVKVFRADQMGLSGDWQAAFPVSLGRFPLQGSAKRYVHGGFSLQEVVLPVVHIHKARTDDTGLVSVDWMRLPAKITTGQVALSLYQEKPVTLKLLPRELRVGLFSKEGLAISEIKTIKFDSKDEEARNRETNVLLVLSRAADEFNDKMVELRLDEVLPGTSQTVTYKSHSIKIQKPFASDFDEH